MSVPLTGNISLSAVRQDCDLSKNGNLNIAVLKERALSNGNVNLESVRGTASGHHERWSSNYSNLNRTQGHPSWYGPAKNYGPTKLGNFNTKHTVQFDSSAANGLDATFSTSSFAYCPAGNYTCSGEVSGVSSQYRIDHLWEIHIVGYSSGWNSGTSKNYVLERQKFADAPTKSLTYNFTTNSSFPYVSCITRVIQYFDWGILNGTEAFVNFKNIQRIRRR